MTNPHQAAGINPARDAARREVHVGLAMAVAAYSLWGLSPILYRLLAHIAPVEIIAHRAIWSVLFVGGYMALRGRLGEVAAILRDGVLMKRLLASAFLIMWNWSIFVWAIGVGRTLEVSFGYFINPIISVLIGIVMLGERLSLAQMLAVALSCVAIAVQAYGLGGLPWVSLSLAGTFAVYGYLRKLTPVRATPGLLVETLVYCVLAVPYLVWLTSAGRSNFLADEATPWLLILTGPATAVPLILFAASARRLTLVAVGITQYLAPSIQFLLAVFVFLEPIDPVRLTGFALVWLALAIFTVDAVVSDRRSRRASSEAAPGPAPV